MAAPALDPKLPLPKLRNHTRHTLLKLRLYSWAKPLGTQLESLQKEVDGALSGERRLNDAIADAETVVDICDLDLNGLARNADSLARGFFSGALLKEVREALFGPEPVSTFIRPLLGSQLRGTRNWPKYLATLAAPNLKALIPSVEAAVKAADSAIDALTQAEVDLENFRTGTHYPLVHKVDLLFHDIWSEAVRKAKETGVSAENAGLFLSNRRRRPALTLARARAELTARENDVIEARASLAELEADAQAELESDKRQEALREQISVLKKGQAETTARIKALEDELDKEK